MNESDVPKNLYELAKALPNYIRNIEDFQMNKQVGKGGFGEVWLAYDSKTKRQVAVKTLFAKKLGGKLEKTFIREVFTNAKCKDVFIIPLIGFTPVPPYAIITEFAPGGNLADYVWPGMSNFDKLKPNQLTFIAMGLAHALAATQKANVCHRDIKPANILLNEKKAPLLCDFGIARVVDTENYMTRRSGTLIYMAPELYNNRDYDTMVDVYSYGIMLWEIVEKTHAYQGLDKNQMVHVLETGTDRPKFKNCKGELKNLIQACWNKDPSKRPTFRQIYKEFATGKVGFPGYDKKVIKKMAEQIRLQEKKPIKEPRQFGKIDRLLKQLREEYQITDAPPPPSALAPSGMMKSSLDTDDTDSEPEPISKISSKSSKTSSATKKKKPKKVDLRSKLSAAPTAPPVADLSTLRPTDPSFLPSLWRAARSLQPSGFEVFYKACAGGMAGAPSEEVGLGCMAALYAGMEAQPAFVELCVRCGLFQQLPVNTPARLEATMALFGAMFQHAPYCVQPAHLEWLNYFVQAAPVDAVSMLSHYVSALPPERQVMQVLDLIVKQAQRYFESPAGYLYLTVLTHILTTNRGFAATYGNTIKEIIAFFTKSPVPDTAAAAYCALGRIFDGTVPINFDEIAEHAKVPTNQRPIACLLLRVYNAVPADPQAVTALLNLARGCDEGSFLLLMAAEANPALAQIVAADSTWQRDGLPTPSETLKLAMLLMSNATCRPQLVANPEFPALLAFLAASTEDYVVGSIAVFLSKAAPDAQLVMKLSQAGFVRSLAETIPNLVDKNVIASTAIAVDILAKAGPAPDFPLLVPAFLGVLRNVPEAGGAAITALASLCSYPDVASIVGSYGVVEYFNMLVSHPSYTQILTAALSKIPRM